MLKRLYSASLLIGLFLMPFACARAATINTSLSMPQNNLGLVGWWTFNGGDITQNISDKSGQGDPGFMSGFTSTSSAVTTGKLGQAFQFDGVDDYITAGIKSPLNLSTTGSLSLWFKVDPADEGQFGYMAGTGNWGADLNGYLIAMYGSNTVGNLQMEIANGSTQTYIDTGGNYADGKWHLAALAWDGSTMRTYVDGNLKGTDVQVTPLSNVYPFNIGNDPAGGDQFKGSLDDVRVYNRALSATEIQQLYASSAAKLQANASSLAQGSSLSKGLAGWWTLDGKDTPWTSSTAGTAIDRSGNGSTGTLTNMNFSASPATGKLGQALSFNGSSSYIDMGLHSALNLTTTGSVSAWVNIPASAANTDVYFAGTDDFFNDANGYVIGMCGAGCPNPGVIAAEVANASSAADVTTNPVSYADGKWHLVTSTWNGTSLSLYIDASLIGTTPQVTPVSNVYSFSVGRSPATSDQYFSGKMDDIRVYNRALSAAEVKQLYALGGSKLQSDSSSLTQSSSLSTSLVGLWTFDGKDIAWTSPTAATAIDRSGNGNTADLIDMSLSSSPIAGKIGQALSFDGVSQFVSTQSAIALPAAATISAWIRYDGAAAADLVIHGGDLDLNLDTYAGFSPNSCESCGAVGTVPVNDGKWHHVVGVTTGSTFTIYTDGGDAQSVSASYSGSSESLGMGYTGLNGHYFSGDMDDVRAYSRALSAAEVKQLYALGR